MPLISDESALSRRSSYRNKGSSVEFEYHIQDESDDLTVYATIEASAAPTYNGLILTSIDIDPEESANNDLWLVRLTYGDPDSSKNEERPDTGDMEWAFSIVGRQEHIELGLQNNIPYTAPGGPAAPAVLNIIGLTKDGNGVQVAGTDIGVGNGRFSETHYLAGSLVDINYYRTLEKLAYTTNQAPFRGFDIGEVLFTGCNGTRRGRGDWAVTFDFETSANKQNFMVGQIQVNWKPGWEYIWIMYEDAVSNDQLIRRPLHAFVLPVYAQGDYSGLQIGTA